MKDSVPVTPQQTGFVLISVLITMLFVVVAGVATAQLAASNFRASNVERNRLSTQMTADAGLDSAVQEINGNSDWTGTVGEVTLLEEENLRTTYQTSVTNDSDPLKKFVTVTARAYSPVTSTEPQIERTYQVALRGVTSGNYSVVSGVGGLKMTNSSKVIGGNVYVNGDIEMSNTAQIGMTNSPVEVRVAHQNCPTPANSTYPRVCTNGENGQPIKINNSAKIYGKVIATNQTDGGSMLNPGLVSGTAAPAAMPAHDRGAQVAAISSTQSSSAAGCKGGTRTWPANLKITGNVTISNGCTVTVQGDVWITGTLKISNSSIIRVANGLTQPPVIMIDGSGGFEATNSSRLASNSANVGFRVITYWSRASCSPDCADVTGADLYNSSNTTTIELSNSSDGPNTEFFARWSTVEMGNSGNIGALVGQRVLLTNSATVTFGTTVTGTGGVAGWVVDSYKRNF